MADESAAEVKLQPIIQVDGESFKVTIGDKEIEVVDPTAKGIIKQFSPLEAKFNELAAAASAVADLSIPKNRKAAGTLRASIISLGTEADKLYKAWNRPYLDAAALARDFVKAWEARVDKIRKPLDQLIEAADAAKALKEAEERRVREEREAAIKTKIAAIDRMPLDHVMSESATVADILASLKLVVIKPEVFDPFVTEAEAARVRAIGALEEIHKAALAREAQQAELQRQREEQERAEAERQQRAKEEADRLEEQRKRLEADRIAVEAERRRQQEEAAAQVERDRQALVQAGQTQARMLTEQVDSFEQHRTAAQQELNQRAAELDQRASTLTEQELQMKQALKDAERKDEPVEQPAAEPSAEPISNQGELDIDAEIGDANAAVAEERADDRAEAAVPDIDPPPAPPAPAPAPAPGATSFGFSAARATAGRGGSVARPTMEVPSGAEPEPVQRPDDYTLLQAVAATYNQPAAVVLSWLEEMDFFELRKVVGPQA